MPHKNCNLPSAVTHAALEAAIRGTQHGIGRDLGRNQQGFFLCGVLSAARCAPEEAGPWHTRTLQRAGIATPGGLPPKRLQFLCPWSTQHGGTRLDEARCRKVAVFVLQMRTSLVAQ
jgi:hypothetical protein